MTLPDSIDVSKMWVRLHYDAVNKVLRLDSKDYHLEKPELKGAYAVLRVHEWGTLQEDRADGFYKPLLKGHVSE